MDEAISSAAACTQECPVACTHDVLGDSR
jgi:hypothetical protein